jgi:hypothetical protein
MLTDAQLYVDKKNKRNLCYPPPKSPTAADMRKYNRSI